MEIHFPLRHLQNIHHRHHRPLRSHPLLDTHLEAPILLDSQPPLRIVFLLILLQTLFHLQRLLLLLLHR
jgi:hypothetical protein